MLSERIKLLLATLAAVSALALFAYQCVQFRWSETSMPWEPTVTVPTMSQDIARLPANVQKTDSGKRLLWARGPRDSDSTEWFDITDSPLDPDGYEHGIGKDSIPAIDAPEFVPIEDRETLTKYGYEDGTLVLGYVHQGQAKAYPVNLMNRHELVNDVIGGKPITVGW